MWVIGAARQAGGLALSAALLGLVLLLTGCGPPIQITPAQAQAAGGASLQLTATQLGIFGKNEDVTSQVTWSSSNSAVASVSGGGTPGVVSALTPGSVTIYAKLSGATGSMTFTVTSAALKSIEVTPAAPSLPNGLTQPFIATGIYSDNSTQDLTTQVIWVSSSPAVATISNAAGTNGLASAVTVGTTTLSATSGNITGSTSLTITSATLVSIAVTPATPSIPKGVSRSFTATGLFSDNSTQNLTTQVTWSSSDPSVATVSNAGGSQGLASSAAPGSTTISAVLGSVSGSTGLTVTSATLVSIAVTPATPSIADGLTEPFTATGTYTDHSTQNLTTQVTWSSSDPSLASVSNASGSQGLASAVAVGSTTISARSAGIAGSTSLTVTSATLVSIAVTPATPSIADGLAEPFTATGTYTDHSTQNLTTQVTWSSSDPSVASVSNAGGSQGLASSVAVGSTTISATSGGIAGSTSLTVTSATLVSIAVTPANPSIANGLTKPFTATGTYTDHSTQNLSTQVTWSSSDPSVASVSNAGGSQGLASSAAAGSTTISATSGGIAGSTSLTVTSATLLSIVVTPANPSIAHGLNEPFTATGTYTDNSTQNLTTQVTWASSNTSVATISNAAGSQGLASSAAVGGTSISATSGSVSGSTTLTVTAATLVSIAVTPTDPSIVYGLSEQFLATGTYTDNSTQNLTTQVTWGSSNTSVATISNASGSQGLASSAAVGSTTISATSGVISGSTSLTGSAPNGFAVRKMVTIDHTQTGNSDSLNFPMLFSGTYADMATTANGGSVENTATQEGISVPADAVFTSDAGCTSALSWEVESYDGSAGAVAIWVRIPALSHTVDTVIYLCVGNSAVTSFQGGSTGATWDSNYQAVYHFPDGTTLSAADSTSNGNDGTINGVTAVPGEIGGGASGSGQQGVDISTPLPISSGNTNITIEGWAYQPASGDSGCFYKLGNGGDGIAIGIGQSVGCDLPGDELVVLYEYIRWVGTGHTFGSGAWHQFALVVDSSGEPNVYEDGSLVYSDVGAAPSPIGSQGSPTSQIFGYESTSSTNRFYNGNLDEIRISNTARSADWIIASYNNQVSPSAFYTVVAD